jgi:ribonuclease BN (tRNA processing enzyme)
VALDLAAGVDVLLHDAQYTAEEFVGPRTGFGHTTIDYAVALAEKAHAKHLVLFHHDSQRTDDALDAIVANLQDRDVKVTAAAEGDLLTIPA